MVRTLDEHRIIHDLSHLAEESFWQLLDLSDGPVMASHSNCRAIVPTDRQLSDEMIKAIVERDGVIGINFFDKFLLPPDEYGTRRATLADVARHARHICDLTGDARHVGIGTDMDGGLGRDEIPQEIITSADLPRVAEALAAAGFGDEDVHGFMGGNWVRFFRRALPQGPATR
jgi:membrane dipeptidase